MKKLLSNPVAKTVAVVLVVGLVIKFVVPKLPLPASVKKFIPFQ